MSLASIGNSGKSAAIVLEKELTPSTTTASLVTVTLVFESAAAAAVQILVNKLVVAEVQPAGVAAVSDATVSFTVAAGQAYEVKKAVKLKEALASIASFTTTEEAAQAAEAASVAANQVLAEKNAKILSLTSK